MTIGERLREALRETGKSQRRLAVELVGSDDDARRVENMRRQIARYLADASAPEPERAARLAELLGKPADYFVDGTATRARTAEELRRLADGFESLRVEAEEWMRRADEDREGAPSRHDRRLRELAAGIRDLAEGQEAGVRDLIARQESILAELRELRSIVEGVLEQMPARPRRRAR